MTTSTIATDVTNQTILQKLELLIERVGRLEREVSLIRANGTQDPIVATFNQDNQIYEIRQSEVETLRRSMIKEYPDHILHEQLLIKKMTEYRAEHYTDEQWKQEFIKSMDAIREHAIASGTAINEEWEAAIDD